MSITLSSRCNPSIVSCSAGVARALLSLRASDLYNVSISKVDLPPPETPVTQVNVPSGISASTFLRLLPRAFFTVMHLPAFVVRRFFGTGTCLVPARYCPVRLFLAEIIFAGAPCAIILPPCRPAPGPISTTWSAAIIASSSCSTTTTVLPRSRNLTSVSSKRVLSR